MSVMSIMEPKTEVSTDTGACVSHIYAQMIDAASVETISQVESSIDWCGSMQLQIAGMVHKQSVKRSIHRDIGAEALEYVPEDYESLLNLLSGLGLAIAEVSERLRAAKAQIETDQLNQRRGTS